MHSGCYVELRVEPDALPAMLKADVVERRANGAYRVALREYGALESLMRELRTAGVRVQELEVMQPDLEEVFVQIMHKA
jgi:ABC-2 type transport system ATP-binding protein